MRAHKHTEIRRYVYKQTESRNDDQDIIIPDIHNEGYEKLL